MILPVLPDAHNWFMPIFVYPEQLGVFAISVMVNIVLTIGVMYFYAWAFIKRAFNSYVQERATNMETLIALGSLSAFALFLFFVVRYSLEQSRGAITDYGQAVMDLNEALTSASIIVLVVTVGKHF